MKKSKKGMTLVEVLVAITVLSIIVFALLSTLVSMRKVVARQEEYVKIKMVCQDIEAYRDKYKSQWAEYYFNNGVSYENQKSVGYLTSSFKPTSDESQAEYKISFQDSTDEKISKLSIIKTSDLKVLVKDLCFPLK